MSKQLEAVVSVVLIAVLILGIVVSYMVLR
jgi:hypothetical protein